MFTILTYFEERNRLLRNPVKRVPEKAKNPIIDLVSFQGTELSIISGILLLHGLYLGLTLDNTILGIARSTELIDEEQRNYFSDVTTIRAMLLSLIVMPIVITAQLIAALPISKNGFSTYFQTLRQLVILNACIGLIPTTLFAMHWSLLDKIVFYNQMLTDGQLFSYRYEPDEWPEEIRDPVVKFLNTPINLAIMFAGSVSFFVLAYQYLFQIPNLMFRVQNITSKSRKVISYFVNGILMMMILPMLFLVFSEITKVFSFQIASIFST